MRDSYANAHVEFPVRNCGPARPAQELPRRRYIALVLLSALVVVLVGQPAAAKPRLPELQELREEISLLNLLRGLYLSPDQVKKLAALAQKADTARNQAEEQVLADKNKVMGAFSALRDQLYGPIGSEKDSQAAASQLDKRLKDAVGAVTEQVLALESEAAGVLSSSQQRIVNDFKPCLIPPKSLRDPVRVGQASGGGEKTEKLANLIYAIPEPVWKTRGQGLVKKIVDYFEQESGAMSPQVRTDVEGRMNKIAAGIRGASSVDFQLQKQQFADQLMLIDKSKALKHGHRQTGKVAQFLLSDAAARVLPRWLPTAHVTATGPACLDCIDDGEAPLVGAQTSAQWSDLADRLPRVLKRLHKERRGNAGLPSLDKMLAPLNIALAKRSSQELLRAVVDSLRTLHAHGPSEDLAKATARTIHQVVKALELPILHREIDPLGYVAQLDAIKDKNDPKVACPELLTILDEVVSFVKN